MTKLLPSLSRALSRAALDRFRHYLYDGAALCACQQVKIRSPWTGCADAYRRMAAVLEHSARRHNPDADVLVTNVDPSPTSRSPAFLVKARAWTAIIQVLPEGSNLVLLDTDTLVLGQIYPVFDSGDWDVAITTRGPLSTLNSGVLFVRVSHAVKQWIEPWERMTEPWCARNEPGRVRFGDQDALKQLCGRRSSVRIRHLPCRIWNAEQHCWPPSSDTRIVHVKSDARRILFGGALHGNVGAHEVAAMWLAEEMFAGSE